MNRGLIKIRATPTLKRFCQTYCRTFSPVPSALNRAKYLVRLAPRYMIIWENSFSRDSAEGVSDFLSPVSGFDRSAILKPMHRVSGHVRSDESLTPEPAMSGSSRRVILLDAPVGLFGTSRHHWNCTKYLAHLLLCQIVTRKSLAQEIRLLRSRQTFRR
jgi:hypothetical protein